MQHYTGKKILITGGAGFIGSHLVDRLVKSGAVVRVFDNLSDGTIENLSDSAGQIELIQADLLDSDMLATALDGIDMVFHLAANASVPRSVNDPIHDFQCNAQGTLNLLNALRGANVERCLVASSGAVYGQPMHFPIKEEDALQPISPYGATKMSVEALSHAFHASYKLPVRIARLFNTYGPRQPRFVMYDLYRKLRADPSRLEIFGNGQQVRDYCYVSDTVDGLLCLAQIEEENCRAYNVSSGQSYTVLEVAHTLIRILGLSDVDIHFTGSSWAGDAQRWEVSIDRLVTCTGYTPQCDLVQGLTYFVEWFDAHPERLR